MSQFYGTVDGSRGQATRQGTKASGIVTKAASWAGGIQTHLFEDRNGAERYRVEAIRWHGHGESFIIAEGFVGEKPDYVYSPSPLVGE